jgi:hypothetical protein
MSYLGPNELIYNNNLKEGIYSGGFSVNSVMMREGISPIITLNADYVGGAGDSDKVSDIFSNLVIPNWAFSYGKSISGGTEKEINHDDNESESDIIDDDLHDKLLDLVKEETKKNKHKNTKKSKSKNKNGTKKQRV